MYDLFGKAFFSYTKPESLVKTLSLQATKKILSLVAQVLTGKSIRETAFSAGIIHAISMENIRRQLMNFGVIIPVRRYCTSGFYP